jgi:hypothetical protein
VSGTNLFASEDHVGGVYLSTDNGTSWTEASTGLNAYCPCAFAVSGANLFAGTLGDGVFLSTNNGTSWTEVNTGLTSIYVNALAVSGTNLFAGTGGGGVWRRPLSEMVTSVEGFSTDLPKGFSLDQNYPNPFNPTTKIRFSVGTYGYTSLRVFDLLGREVSTLVNEEMNPGTYSVTWDATGMPSGVYFYRLSAGAVNETKKLLLLR